MGIELGSSILEPTSAKRSTLSKSKSVFVENEILLTFVSLRSFIIFWLIVRKETFLTPIDDLLDSFGVFDLEGAYFSNGDDLREAKSFDRALADRERSDRLRPSTRTGCTPERIF